MDLVINRFYEPSKLHYDLLLDADPSIDNINSYLCRSICFESKIKEETVGIIILLPTRPHTAEIVNVAVLPKYQGQGIAQNMINSILKKARSLNIKTITVGTGSTSFKQLYLYQKCGFRVSCIDTNFFLKHYDFEIIENGLVLKDMIRLSIDLF